MPTNELKPCPFCGGRAKHVYFRYTETHSVWCKDCGAESYEFDTEEEAIEAWNTRGESTFEPEERTCTFSVYQTGDEHFPTCSVCGYEAAREECEDYVGVVHYEKRFCPNCGAKVIGD